MSIRCRSGHSVSDFEHWQSGGALMVKHPTADMIAEGLTMPQRVLLFCTASATH
jgi:hypothetical protein